ncbi:MAG: hypothetical protein U5R06_08415 [candidate division KSB1 bacterium]|nr:hypothetical protein [candidate division KSB1 bacterium]
MSICIVWRIWLAEYDRAGKHNYGVDIRFDYSSFNGKITPIGRLSGQSGWMLMTALTIDSFEPEDYLVAAYDTRV